VILPHKNIEIYENGIQFISKQGIKSYHWQQFENINIRIVKSKDRQELIGHAYDFRFPDGTDIIIGISEYPNLSERLTNILMEYAHEIVSFSDVYV
jgi:hypothetical protein